VDQWSHRLAGHDVRTNLDSTFGRLIETAVHVRTGSNLDVWIQPAPVALQLVGFVPPNAADVAVRFALRDGALVRVALDP